MRRVIWNTKSAFYYSDVESASKVPSSYISIATLPPITKTNPSFETPSTSTIIKLHKAPHGTGRKPARPPTKAPQNPPCTSSPPRPITRICRRTMPPNSFTPPPKTPHDWPSASLALSDWRVAEGTRLFVASRRSRGLRSLLHVGDLVKRVWEEREERESERGEVGDEEEGTRD